MTVGPGAPTGPPTRPAPGPPEAPLPGTPSPGSADPAGTTPAGTGLGGRPRPSRPLGVAERLPSWMGSIRVRLTVLYSVVLFGLSGLVLGGVYLAQARSLQDEPVSREFNVTRLQPVPGGVVVEERTARGVIQGLEAEINDRTLAQLRQWSITALGVLFVASLGVGWVVAGRVLRPIGRITEVARDIQATDLSRRIALEGPQDELRALADTFDDMLARLDTAFASQRRFIEEASHELRNPLAVMRTNLDVALADPDASTEDLRRTAELVRRTTERMSGTVADLLAYGRHEPPELAVTPVSLTDLAEGVVAEFAPAAGAEGVVVRAGVDPGLVVPGDRAALRQALRNLVDNAVRAAPAGSTVSVAGGRDHDWARVSVTDQGPGIPAAQQAQVFRRFWRGSEEGRGSGLGLAIVCQVADAHGGEIRLESAEGTGSTFTLWLPVEDRTGSRAVPPAGS